MTASGPFAMGPVAAGMSGASRRGPSSNFITPMGQPGGAAALGKNLGGVQPALASAKGDERDKGKESDNGKGKGKEVKKEDKDEEVYSDADDGVEIVDMEDVKTLDWMAPDSLRRVREGKKVKKIKVKVKLEDEGGAALDGKWVCGLGVVLCIGDCTSSCKHTAMTSRAWCSTYAHCILHI
jgi:DNA-directed RNA polymerase III subunit RPC4